MSRGAEYIIAITGASGSIYGVRLAQELLKREYRISLLVSGPGKLVIAHELGYSLEEPLTKQEIADKLDFKPWVELLEYYRDDDFMAPICSGSHRTEAMIVIPCSMSTLSAVANGISSSLIERTADVMLKESRRLVMVPRETPLSRIHLKNMLAVQEAGAEIVPAMPAFYHNPKTIDDMVNFVVGKVLDMFGIEHDLFQRWDG